MAGKIALRLLIIFVIWCQEIIGAVADEDIKSSLDNHNLVRQKRVINRIIGEDKSVVMSTVPYVVKVRKLMRIHCVGSILSEHVIITSASCVGFRLSEYHVLSGGSRTETGFFHNVTNIKKHVGDHPHRPEDGIALLTVDPPIVYKSSSFRIELHSGPLLEGTLGTVSGWGYSTGINDPGTCHTRNLRSIEVPIISHRDCVNRYRPHIVISDLDLCTYHPLKKCGHTDEGAPLVVDGFLAGVRLWSGGDRILNDPQYPDVFAILQHPAYNQWIRSNI